MPSTILHSAPIQGLHSAPVAVSGFLEKLHHLIGSLLNTILEASDDDKLAVFEGNPMDFDDPTLDANSLWETVLNALSCAVTTPVCHLTLPLASASLPIFFPCAPHPFYTFPHSFYIFPHSFYIFPHPFCHFPPTTVFPHPFRPFSVLLPPFRTASASEHVSRASAHFRHCILSLLSLPLTSADILPFIHPYICLYICSGSHVCSFSLNIDYRPPPFMSVRFCTLPFPSNILK